MPIRVGYFSGVWDLLHIGHIRALEQAKALCDILVVGVCTDEHVIGYKGIAPTIPYKQRLEVMKSIQCIDEVIPRTSFYATAEFEEHGVNIRIVGPEYGRYPGQREMLPKHSKIGIKVVVLPRTPNISTSLIKEAIRENKSVVDYCSSDSSGLNKLCGEETKHLDLCHNSS